MGILEGFYVFLATTALGIAASLYTGKKGLRKAHLAFVLATAALLLVTLYFAKRVGEIFDFEPVSHDIHMPIARAAFLSLLGPFVTGPLLWFGKIGRRAHRIAVWIFLAILVLALGTGAWMMAAATPKAL